MRRYFKELLRQERMGVRRRRWVEKQGLRFDLKIETVKRVAKKMLTGSSKKNNVLLRTGLFCSKLFACLENYSANLEILD